MPVLWIVGLNVTGWLIVQIGLAWAFTRMPIQWFKTGPLFRWEWGGQVYDRIFHVRVWKRYLPDGAAWFPGGFAKRSLEKVMPDYLERFCRETWRGELCHWAALACTPMFFLWNPDWADGIVTLYALLANGPCIVVQRFNRARLQALMVRICSRT
ncbi:MAG: glycosyl-4,4'-diaponeurosporenoate acyltransferase [Verrucomicrobiota bacterium]|nr:hypothetical protein [Limisphaera sp.]MDW8380609.1 glycosyl-4,4'-diaponeurosporenoate acyltransferase [Verrucomicrobiota bacterium]